MGKSSINGPFSMAMLNYQMVHVKTLFYIFYQQDVGCKLYTCLNTVRCPMMCQTGELPSIYVQVEIVKPMHDMGLWKFLSTYSCFR